MNHSVLIISDRETPTRLLNIVEKQSTVNAQYEVSLTSYQSATDVYIKQKPHIVIFEVPNNYTQYIDLLAKMHETNPSILFLVIGSSDVASIIPKSRTSYLVKTYQPAHVWVRMEKLSTLVAKLHTRYPESVRTEFYQDLCSDELEIDEFELIDDGEKSDELMDEAEEIVLVDESDSPHETPLLIPDTPQSESDRDLKQTPVQPKLLSVRAQNKNMLKHAHQFRAIERATPRTYPPLNKEIVSISGIAELKERNITSVKTKTFDLNQMKEETLDRLHETAPYAPVLIETPVAVEPITIAPQAPEMPSAPPSKFDFCSDVVFSFFDESQSVELDDNDIRQKSEIKTNETQYNNEIEMTMAPEIHIEPPLDPTISKIYAQKLSAEYNIVVPEEPVIPTSKPSNFRGLFKK